jgi:Asp-tRNA(Asn)/Glu-tRNA(Gln) amidotransferase A subunit family amidase
MQTLGILSALIKRVRAGKSGPLLGIAVGVKDIFDTADFPTQMGSALYARWRPRSDAWIVTKLRCLGASIVGKTTTAPFASSDPTATRNPLNPAHTPGGFSAGSAAAVAAGFVQKLDATRGTRRTEYNEALPAGQQARSEIEDIFKHVDVILTLSASGPAPHGFASTGEAHFNRLWTLLGVPCVNVPIHPRRGGLPVGVQLIAPFRADRLAVEAASALATHLLRVSP